MSITVTMDPKEVEHFFIFLCFTVSVIALCYMTHLFHKNNK